MRIMLLVILLGALALTWWALHPEEESRPRAVAGNARIIDYFVEGLELTTFDAQGFPLRRLESDSLRHYRGSGETLLARPRFTLFGTDGPLWRVVSESGTLVEDHSRLDLEGAVEIHRSGSDERPPIEIRTRNVLVSCFCWRLPLSMHFRKTRMLPSRSRPTAPISNRPPTAPSTGGT